MTLGSHHHRFRPVMSGAIAITSLVLVMGAVLRLDVGIAGYAVGALVLVCLAVCGAALWIDGRAGRATARLATQVRRRSRE